MKSLQNLFILFALLSSNTVFAAEKFDIVTSAGTITVELDDVKAPKSTENFMAYALSGFYNGTIFHRVIKDFMVQGGGFTTDYHRKQTNTAIKNEAQNGLQNKKYTLAMARTGRPHSATSQFFINTSDNGFLNHTAPNPRGWGYAVFGQVVKGFDVVDKINSAATGPGGPFAKDAPREQVVILKVEPSIPEKK